MATRIAQYSPSPPASSFQIKTYRCVSVREGVRCGDTDRGYYSLAGKGRFLP